MDMKSLFEQLASTKMTDVVKTARAINRKTLISVGAGALGAVLFFIFLFYPGWCKRPALYQQSIAIESQMTQLNALNLKKPQLVMQKKEIQSLIQRFQKKIFTEEGTSFLLGAVSKLAEDSQVDLITSKPLEGTEDFPLPYSQKYKKYIYHITLDGSYHSIAHFISRLESYSHYFQIQSLSIVPQPGPIVKHTADIKLMAVSHKHQETSLKETLPVSAAPPKEGLVNAQVN